MSATTTPPERNDGTPAGATTTPPTLRAPIIASSPAVPMGATTTPPAPDVLPSELQAALDEHAQLEKLCSATNCTDDPEFETWAADLDILRQHIVALLNDWISS